MAHYAKVNNGIVEQVIVAEADLVTIQQLKKIAFTQFQNLATEFTNTLAQEVFQSTLLQIR